MFLLPSSTPPPPPPAPLPRPWQPLLPPALWSTISWTIKCDNIGFNEFNYTQQLNQFLFSFVHFVLVLSFDIRLFCCLCSSLDQNVRHLHIATQYIHVEDNLFNNVQSILNKNRFISYLPHGMRVWVSVCLFLGFWTTTHSISCRSVSLLQKAIFVLYGTEFYYDKWYCISYLWFFVATFPIV